MDKGLKKTRTLYLIKLLSGLPGTDGRSDLNGFAVELGVSHRCKPGAKIARALQNCHEIAIPQFTTGSGVRYSWELEEVDGVRPRRSNQKETSQGHS